jgi:hypothetical protein
MTAETVGDWETCLSGATNKADPNRMRWLFELLVDKDNLFNSKDDGAFKESSYLRLLNRSLIQNWKLRELFNKTYDILKDQVSHPYNKVRLQISKMMATLLSVDIDYIPGWNMGQNYPNKVNLINHVVPKINLNFHNPVLNGLVSDHQDENSSSRLIFH